MADSSSERESSARRHHELMQVDFIVDARVFTFYAATFRDAVTQLVDVLDAVAGGQFWPASSGQTRFIVKSWPVRPGGPDATG